MEFRRRARPAAVAAALLGLGLALYRPRLVPELRARPRSAPPSVSLASAIGWTPASAGNAALDNSDEPGSPIPSTVSASDEDGGQGDRLWRDALADRTWNASGNGQTSAGFFSSAAPARAGKRPGPAPAAEKDAPPASGAARRPSGPTARTERPDDGWEAPGPAAARRRVPLARGPAGVDDPSDYDDGGTVDPRGEPGPPGEDRWSRARTRAFPLFRPPRRPPGARTARAGHRVRPLLLSRLLGRGALRPPASAIVPPDLSRLKARKPARLPDGAAVPADAYALEGIEAQDPRLAGSCRRRAPHWDSAARWHEGPARGLIADARWLWLWKEKTRWWAVEEPAYDSALLRQGALWWSKRSGVWFALHDGEYWTWRLFSDWDAEGLVRLKDGVELVYSADFTKVALITPGAGAVLYDAATGAELGEWLESEMPRRRPRAPARLRLPTGI